MSRQIRRRAVLRTAGLLASQVLIAGCSATPPAPQTPAATVPLPTIILRTATRVSATGPGRGIGPSVPVSSVIATLRPEHPRLLLTDGGLADIRHLLADDARAREYLDAVMQQGERLLDTPPVQRTMVGGHLLTTSQAVLDRLYTLALLHRLDGDGRWAARATTELLAVAAFGDWNPAHFLDVAEMTHAFAVGYDWLHAALSAAERTTVRSALVEKGLRPAERAYQAGASWISGRHNWNLVSNAGVIVGALAIADEEPELANFLLARAVSSFSNALSSYAPDGAWLEGPEYWGYATGYVVTALAALQSAAGTDLGLGAYRGLAETGIFRVRSVGPTGLAFNFGDAQERLEDAATLSWLARRYDVPALAVAARAATATWGFGRRLLWYDSRGTAADVAMLAPDACYHGVHVAHYRASWDDPRALFLGLKGGVNGATHAHLDAGTFVLDALGQRWAIDLGGDDATLPGYFDQGRWGYYRVRTEGHNTLTLDGQNQGVTATCPLAACGTMAGAWYAIADLTTAYASSGAVRVRRGAAAIDTGGRVVLRDEITTMRPAEIAWALHTRAEVTIVSTSRAILRQGGEQLEARILAPDGAAFTVREVALPTPQWPTTGVRKLMIGLPQQTTDVSIVVILTPGGAPAPPPPTAPLDRWPDYGPLL